MGASAAAGAPTARPAQMLDVSNGIGIAKVGNGPRVFNGWELKSYRLGIAPEAAAVDLRSVTRQDGEVEIAFDHPQLAYLSAVFADLGRTDHGAKWSFEDENVRLVRETTSGPDQNWVDVAIRAEFKTVKPAYAFVSLVSQSWQDDPEAHDRQLLYWTNNSLERVKLSDNFELKSIQTPVKWIGAQDRYFLMALISPDGSTAQGLLEPKGLKTGRISLVYPVVSGVFQATTRAYFGPKELDVLRTVDKDLTHTVDFGWFTMFAYPLLRLMKWFYDIVRNWGISIILLTVLVKLATFPLTYKSMQSMKQMSRLQPQMAKIRERYKDDKEALNREMLGLMRTHGYNPMAGCLPILIQMPVFFALYRVLYSSIELYHAPFALWIHDLSSKDPFYVTPVLLTVTMFLQQKLTPNTATDPAQARMMQFMPVIFGVFMISLPSGLTLYMLVNALSSILQQLILNKRLGITPNAGKPAVVTRG
jgi:YidC/Oxa1 family membrane protein insertase